MTCRLMLSVNCPFYVEVQAAVTSALHFTTRLICSPQFQGKLSFWQIYNFFATSRAPLCPSNLTPQNTEARRKVKDNGAHGYHRHAHMGAGHLQALHCMYTIPHNLDIGRNDKWIVIFNFLNSTKRITMHRKKTRQQAEGEERQRTGLVRQQALPRVVVAALTQMRSDIALQGVAALLAG